MATCRNCKFLTDVNREVAPDRGWCPMWNKWQMCNSRTCKYTELKTYTPREGNNSRPNYRGSSNQRFSKPNRGR